MRLIPLSILAAALAPPAAAQVSQLAVHYMMDEVAGNTMTDATGNMSGQWQNAYTLGQPGAAAGTGTAVALDASGFGRGFAINAPPLSNLVSDLSISVWVNPTSVSPTQMVIGNRQSGGPLEGSWVFGLVGGDVRFRAVNVFDYEITPPTPIPANAWTHLAATFDENFDVTFWVNGQNIGLVPGLEQLHPTYNFWFIGAQNGSTQYWDGLLDDLQIYVGSLTDPQAEFLFQNPGATVPLQVGQSYCGPAVPNTTGQPGIITAAGSLVVSANQLSLAADQIPPGEFGYFLSGQMQGFFNPPGSSGFLCLSGPIGRYNQPGNIGVGPSFGIQLDLTAIPQPTGTVAAQPGETWNFQCWYRDTATGNNFTDGVTMTFQ